MKQFITILFLLAGASLASAQNAEHGKQVFEKLYCSACHGHEGQGGSSGPRIGNPAPSLARVLSYVRNPSGGMPPFTAKVVSDAELTDVQAYLASRPPAKPLKDIPLLNQ